jgi:hypothetical protein
MNSLHLFLQVPKAKVNKYVGSFATLTEAESALVEQPVMPKGSTAAVLYESQPDGALKIRAYYLQWRKFTTDWRVKHVEEDQGVRRAVEPYRLPVKELA